MDGEQNEGDERDASDAVGLEAVGCGANGVTSIVTRAVCDDAWITNVVLLDLEDDLHEVGADVGDFGEDATGNAESGSAKGLADGEPDEALARVLTRDEEQDGEHDDQLDRDEQHANGHARRGRNGVDRERFPCQTCERRPGVRERVDADAEPRHAVAAQDADDGEQYDDGDAEHREIHQELEVHHHDDRDEGPQDGQELALGDEVGLARFVDEVRDVGHGLVYWHVLEANVEHEAEEHAQKTDAHADQ